MILALEDAILFIGRRLHKEGLPFGSARDIRFSLTGSVNWAGRHEHRVEATDNTVQEGCWAFADTVMKKKMKVRGPQHPLGVGKATQSSAGAYKVDDWMQGLDEGAFDGEGRTSNSPAHCVTGQGRWQLVTGGTKDS